LLYLRGLLLKGGWGNRRGGEGKARIRERGKEGKRREGEGPTCLISTAFADQISYP